jgi:hypothetical protein
MHEGPHTPLASWRFGKEGKKWVETIGGKKEMTIKEVAALVVRTSCLCMTWEDHRAEPPGFASSAVIHVIYMAAYEGDGRGWNTRHCPRLT